MRLLILAVYNLIILAGTAYLVGWHNWNPWWFLFAACCLSNCKDCKEPKPKEEKRFFLKD